MLQACEELGIGFVPLGPVGQGFLPGTLKVDAQSSFDPKTDLRATFPRFSPMVMKNNQPIYGGRMDARQMAQIGQD